MKLNCVVIDDEPLALKLLEDFGKRVPFLHLTASFSSPTQAVDYISSHPCDLVFLDINMPDINGINLLKKLDKDLLAVFCTAYSDNAVEGFELQVIDYLVKPYSFDRFLKAACKAQEQFILRKSFKGQMPPKNEENGFLFIKSEYSLVKVNIPEIILLEGLKDYIKIYTTTNTKALLTLQSLRSLEEKLPAEKFCRVHKSFIVNMSMIKSVQRNFIVLGEREIPMGNQYKDAFMQKVGDHSPGK